MSMSTSQQFRPNWVSAPGDTITDILLERRMSVHELATLLEESPDSTTELLEGRLAITIAMARKLARVLGATVQFWIARDFQYREDAARIASSHQDWLRELPLSDMPALFCCAVCCCVVSTSRKPPLVLQFQDITFFQFKSGSTSRLVKARGN
jgi:plasmid maintenance system antidote protein VapI